MVKIEQTGGRLTEEEILHGKEDAYGIYQINRKGAGRDYAFLSFDSFIKKNQTLLIMPFCFCSLTENFKQFPIREQKPR